MPVVLFAAVVSAPVYLSVSIALHLIFDVREGFTAEWWAIFIVSWLIGMLMLLAVVPPYARWRFEKRRQKIILVDMDGVLANWDAAWDAALMKMGIRALGIPFSVHRKEFNLYTGLTPEQKLVVDEITTSPGFYRHLDLIEGAKEALREMLKAGYDVRIVTSPWNSNPTCASDKMAWVMEHLGKEWGQRLIITNDKTLVFGDWLIDDKPKIKGSRTPSWEHIWFSQPINAGLTGQRRIDAWAKWKEVIAA